MEQEEEREKPRSVSYIPRPFTSPSQPQYREGESFQLGERARTTVSEAYGEDRTRVKPLYPYGKYKSYEEMIDDMNEEDPFRNPGQPGGSSDRQKAREFLRQGSGLERLKEKHERSVAIRKDLVPEMDVVDKNVVKSSDNDKTAKHRRRTRHRRKIREEPGLPVEAKLSGTFTKDLHEYSNPAYEADRGRGSNTKADKYNSRKRSGSRGRSKLTGEPDDGSTGTYTVEEKDDQVKLIKDTPDLGAVSEPMEKSFFKKHDYTPVDKDASARRTGATLNKLRVDSRQTGFFKKSSKHHGVQRTRVALRHYVQANIKHRHCISYVQDPKQRDFCKCGRDITWHIEEGIVVNRDNQNDLWDVGTHTKLVDPTCFGEVFFNGFGRESKQKCPYIRITPDTPPEVVFKIMSEYWCLPPPKLLISVTGGAKQFHLKKRLNTVFKRGLIDAARTTSAWIVTGGLNAGVMKVVGESVKEHQLSSGHAENIVSIGIATWGYVDNLDALEGEDENGAFPATYNIEDLSLRRGCSPLDQNHTHFILVDNGTERKPGVEIPFRAALEEYVSNKMETVTGVDGDFVNVPVVMLVLEGGMNSLKTAAETLKKNMPVVLIQGSGRAADFLACAFKTTKARTKDDGTDFPKDFDDRMRFRAANLFDWSRATEESKAKDIDNAVKMARECLVDRKLVTVYTLDDRDSEQSKYIDKAILTALLKANRSNAATQLGLALAWNRCDMAREEIFTPENRPQWQHLRLHNAMFTALVQDRVDFVQLFLDMGVELKRFLTVARLRDLYYKVIKDKYAGNSRDLLKNLIREVESSIKHHFFFCCAADEWKGNHPNLLNTIGKVVQHMMGDMYHNMYAEDKYRVDDNAVDDPKKERAIGQEMGLLSTRSYDAVDGIKHRPTLRKRATRSNIADDFACPEKELLLWSVLLNRRELALMFWRAGRDHIGSSLMASSLLKNLSEKASEEEEIDLANDLLKHSQDFEQLAVGVLTECYNSDKMKTHLALIRVLEKLGGSTCLNIADTGEHMEFMGNTACQTRLNKIWKGNMALYTSTLKVVVACFIPFIIPWIKFTRGDSGLGKVLGYKDEHFLFESGRRVAPSSEEIFESGALEVVDDDEDDDDEHDNRRASKKLFTVSFSGHTNSRTKRINVCRAILYFYTAPITKFIFTSLTYIAFLALFSYMCLTDLNPTSYPNSPGVLEILVWCWAGTMILEEVRQILTKDPRSVQYKLKGWFDQSWNRADLVMYLLFITSVVLRFTLDDDKFVYARTGYAVTLALFYLRFMQAFYVNKEIGPKVIMIKRMLYDVAFFLVIFLVFVLCYGVATQMLLYPNSLPSWQLLKDVVYIPYWQMYGELFIEHVEGQADVTTCSRNRSVWINDPNYAQCPEANAATPLMFAIYMLLTNVLLLNLLIAMFSYTFQKVQDNADLVWRYYRCALFYEYFDRPALAAPLIIFSHIYRFFRYIIYRCCRENGQANNDFKVALSEEDNDKVAEFEKLAMNNYLLKAELQEREHINARVANTGDRLERVIDELEEIKDNMSFKDREDKDDDDDDDAKKKDYINMSLDPMQEVDALHDRLGGLEERLDIQGNQLIELISLMRTIIEGKGSDRETGRTHSDRSGGSEHREMIKMPERRDLDRKGHPRIEIRDPGF
ncbi:transient receptor potential cation channel subfamily M member-like 2 [Lineus longissimus]|uniref:transient receptor potential cation channel subfamily M member-like 2 n=1 Tax=Lineus longissimus TaxID=88925 RepID=UPI002B4F21A7